MIKVNKSFIARTVLVFAFIFIVASYLFIQGLPLTGKTAAVAFLSNQYVHEETLKYSKAAVRFSYPLIESGLTSSSTKAFNDYIKGFAASIFEEYRGWFNDLDKDFKLNTLAENYIEGDYEIIRADESLISIRFNLIRNWEGMAHQYEFTKVLNYSVKDSKSLSLPDLFRTDSHYLEILSSLAKQKVIEGYKIDGIWDEDDNGNEIALINSGTMPDENNFNKFVIGKDYLLFVFDPYEVGAYALSKREAKIMFKELNGYLNEKYLM